MNYYWCRRVTLSDSMGTRDNHALCNCFFWASQFFARDKSRAAPPRWTFRDSEAGSYEEVVSDL